MSSQQECTDSGSTVTRSRKIRIYPDQAQKTLFSKWFGVQRLVYNSTVEYLNQDGKHSHWMSFAKDLLHNLPEFAKEIPYQIKKIAVKEAYDALSAGIKKFRVTGQSFELHFKRRRNPTQSCFIPKSAVSKLGIYSTKSKALIFAENISDVEFDCRLIKENNQYYLNVPFKTVTREVDNQNRLVAIDPGVRNFLTFYSEDNQIGQIGTNDFGRIVRISMYLDDLISRMSKAKGKQKQRMRKAEKRMRWKIKNLVKELHFKSAKFLTDTFDIILLPSFNTKDMVNKATRKIRTKSVRSMLTFAHYKFQQIVKNKAQMQGKKVIIVDESYTSKTNSWTGVINEHLGGAKRIRVGKEWVDRDINGARNILIKWISENMRALGDSPIS
jgi:putative transposase